MKKFQKIFSLIAIITAFALMLTVVGCNNNNGDNSSSSKAENSRISTPSSNDENSSSFEEQSSNSNEENSSSSDNESSSSSDNENSSSSDGENSSSSDDENSSSSDGENSSSSDGENSSSSDGENSSSSDDENSSSSDSENSSSSDDENSSSQQPGQDIQPSNLEYVVNQDGETCSVASCDAELGGTVIIASEFEGKPVTGILENAFNGNENIVKIVVPATITTIGDGAFSNMTALTRVYYEGSIDDYANVTVGENNSDLRYATLYYFSSTQPGSNLPSWNFWHYKNGSIVEWEIYSEIN